MDISNLDVGDVLHVSDLQLPANVKAISHEKMTIATLSMVEDESIPIAATSTGPASTEGATEASGDVANADDNKGTDTPAPTTSSSSAE